MLRLDPREARGCAHAIMAKNKSKPPLIALRRWDNSALFSIAAKPSRAYDALVPEEVHHAGN